MTGKGDGHEWTSPDSFCNADTEHMTKRWWLLAILFALPGTVCLVHGQEPELNYTIRTYLPADGLPQSQVLAVFQDSTGYIWMGSYSGLTRFNGHDFTVFDSTHGLPNNSIVDLVEGEDGSLFLGTYGGGLVCYSDDQFYSIPSAAAGRRPEFIYELLMADDGTLWVIDVDAVYFLRDNVLKPVPELHGTDNNYYTAEMLDDGSMAIGTTTGITLISDGSVWNLDLEIDETHYAYIYAIARNSVDSLYLGTEHGLFLLTLTTDNKKVVEIKEIGDLPTVNDLDINGDDLWISTYAGEYLMNGNGMTKFSKTDGLSNDYIYSTTIDRENNIWLATDYGVSLLTPSQFTTIDKTDGLSDNQQVNDVYEDVDGSVWVSNGAEIVCFEDYEIKSRVGASQGLDVTDVICIAGRSGGDLYIVAYEGLYKWDGETATALYTGYYPSYGFCDSKGRIWLANGYNLFQFVDGKLKTVEATALQDADVSYIREDSKGNLWVATSNDGLIVLNGDTLEDSTPFTQFTRQEIWSIDFDDLGAAWVGSNGDGLFRVSGEQIKQYTTEDGLMNNFIWQVICAGGKVWVNSNAGFDLLDRGSISHFTEANGLLANEGIGGASLLDKEGNIWSCSGFGISIFSADTEYSAPEKMPIHIEEFRANEQVIGDFRNKKLAADQNRIVIRFAALSYRNVANIKYQYRLNESESWSELSRDNHATFAHLGHGNYNFELRATTTNGKNWFYLKETVPFTILPPFYFSVPFMLAVVFLVAALIYLFLRWRMKLLSVSKRLLEKTVDERTVQLNQVLEELSENNRQLNKLNTDLKSFNSVISHDLKSPIVRISSYADLLKESIGETEGEAREFISRIKRNSTVSLNLINKLFSLYTGSNQKLIHSTFNLSQLVLEEFMITREDHRSQHIKLDLQQGIVVDSDQELSRILWANLLENAVKYSKEEDSPTIRFYEVEQGEGRTFCLEDNGPGFPQADAEKVFEFSTRLAGNPQKPGRGIGLSIVQRIVDRLEGRVRAESEPGEGTKIFVTYPGKGAAGE